MRIDPMNFQNAFNEAVECMERYMRNRKAYVYIYRLNLCDEKDFLIPERMIFRMDIAHNRRKIYSHWCNTFSLTPIKYGDFRLNTFRASLDSKDFDKFYTLCKLIGGN